MNGVGSSKRALPLALLAPAWLMVAASVYFGLDASLTVGAAASVAADLLGAGK